MKYTNLTKLLLMAFIFYTSFLTNSCEEAEDLLKDIKLFSFDYDYLPGTVNASTARVNAENGYSTAQTATFIQEDVALAPDKSISNTAKLFGTPSASASQLLLRMERNGMNDDEFVRFITIDVKGPFVVGQVINASGDVDRYVEVLNGPTAGTSWKTYTTKGIADTYFSIEITELNTTTKRIGGKFHGYARFKDSPANSDAMLIHNGTFTVKYQTQ